MQFPDHPVLGDQVTDTETTGRTWEFDGTKWVLVGVVMSDVEFDAESPIEVQKTLRDSGKVGVVNYKFNMNDLPRINPN